MKKLPMMLQLNVILFCIMAVPTAILTWYSGEQILRNSEYAIAESSLAGLNANRKLTENAMNNLSQNTVTLAGTHIFDRIRSYKSYSELNSNYKHVLDAQAVLRELTSLNSMADGVYSSFFYLSDSDYVVSTDNGITKLDRYDSIDWMKEALIGRRGISGVWYPRKLDSGVNVVSYVLPLNLLSTNTRGTIVVNLRESQIENYFSSTEAGKQGYLLMNSTGTIISHSDKSLLLKNGKEEPFIGEIVEHDLTEGYEFRTVEDERMLYAWSRSKRSGWVNVSIYSVNELMINTHILHRNIILVTTVIILAGIILTVVLATWLSKPARKLVQTLRTRTNLGIKGRNELAFLDVAFKRMQEDEQALHKMLKIREHDSRSLAIHNLLRGELTPQVTEMFPAPRFLVAVVSIDQYREYVAKNNSETRSYHYYLFSSKCDSMFLDGMTARSIYQGDGCFVIVINYGQLEQESIDSTVHAALVKIRDKAVELLEHSVTIGVSSPVEAIDMISIRLADAMEVIKHRMVEGSGGITYWKEKDGQDKKYIYPANSERRILNFLDHGDLDSIIKELKVIGDEIRSAEYISYDNILFIYHQLVGISIKHLREKNVSTARIFAGRGNIYTDLASIDTLDELEKYLCDFFGEIVQYLARTPGETKDYGERILKYLEEHFCEDIVYQEMAEEIGISYSYMRKIVTEMTGQSLIDHLNLRRIEKAKQLLVESDLTITQIASEVGYNNVQSFNRFFRKFEGLPPSNYKATKFRAQ